MLPVAQRELAARNELLEKFVMYQQQQQQRQQQQQQLQQQTAAGRLAILFMHTICTRQNGLLASCHDDWPLWDMHRGIRSCRFPPVPCDWFSCRLLYGNRVCRLAIVVGLVSALDRGLFNAPAQRARVRVFPLVPVASVQSAWRYACIAGLSAPPFNAYQPQSQ